MNRGKLSSKARAGRGKAKAGQSKGGITKQGGAKAKQGCQVKRKDAEQNGDGTAGTAEGIVGIAAPPSVLKKTGKRKKAECFDRRPTEGIPPGCDCQHSALNYYFTLKCAMGRCRFLFKLAFQGGLRRGKGFLYPLRHPFLRPLHCRDGRRRFLRR